MKLSGEQVRQLQEAIVEAYTYDALRRAVRVNMEINLQDIVGGNTYRDVVFNLIEWAEKNARVKALVNAICSDNPDNPRLRKLSEGYADLSDETIEDVELTRARQIVSDYMKLWLDSNQSGRGESLIPYSLFGKVDRYRSAFANEEKPVKAYLLRCAVQNGMSGQWGKWLLYNFDNDLIVAPLVRAFTGVTGQRPAWRSAAILQQLPSDCITDTFAKLNENLVRQIGFSGYGVSFYASTLCSHALADFLEQLALDKSATDKARDGARQVLDEMLTFTPELHRFRAEQAICPVNKHSEPD